MIKDKTSIIYKKYNDEQILTKIVSIDGVLSVYNY